MLGHVSRGEVLRSRCNYSAIAQGFVAVVLFSLTVPMTKLALVGGSAEAITASRTFFAGVLSLMIIMYQRWRMPSLYECRWLLLAGFGVVIAFPYCLALSLERSRASEMGIVLAGLPLVTSLMAVIILKESYRWGFWICTVMAAGVLVAYYQQTGDVVNNPLSKGSGELVLLTLFFGGVGYVAGAKVAKSLGAWPAICWMLLLYLPVSALSFGYFSVEFAEGSGLSLTACLAIAYLAVVSQWWGFRYWYGAMAKLGVGVVSQCQLMQPFFTLLFSAVLLSDAVGIAELIYVAVVALFLTGALLFK